MSSVVPIERDGEGVLVVTSETVAQGAGVEHRAVLQLMATHKARLSEFGQVAFEMRPGYNNAQIRVALLNEPQAMLLMTFMKNTSQVVDFKVALIKAFIEMAKQLSTPARSLPSRAELAQWVVEAEAKQAALEAQVAADAPKVLFADAVATSSTTILVGDLAKILRGNGLDIGANRLFERLRNEGFLIRREGSDRNMPTQRAMDMGLFRVKETAVTHSDGHVTVSKTPKVTGKGQAYFVNRFCGSGALAVSA